ncbi:MAG: DUF3135 domain-containing protein [Gammaproteobacteria bacterium]|nr:DUF3135 domain-containing protein [Gammaproteobacteria bacterium]
MIVDTPQFDDVVAGDLEKLSFNDWKELFEKDPERFELFRKRALEYQITLAPEQSKQRLRGLMFQMECEGRKAKTPLSYNMRLNAMMMEAFDDLRLHLQTLCTKEGQSPTPSTQVNEPRLATVLAFDKNQKAPEKPDT